MSKLIPRKIKKACKAYRNDVPLKTKWLRYVHTQFASWVANYEPCIKDYKTTFSTKYGGLIINQIY